jgi:hypothetical protein
VTCFLRFVLLISYHLCVGLLNSLFPLVFKAAYVDVTFWSISLYVKNNFINEFYFPSDFPVETVYRSLLSYVFSHICGFISVPWGVSACYQQPWQMLLHMQFPWVEPSWLCSPICYSFTTVHNVCLVHFQFYWFFYIPRSLWVVGLLTGHCHLKGHLFKMGLTDDPICERCLEEDESATHILCDCDAIANLRFRHLG